VEDGEASFGAARAHEAWTAAASNLSNTAARAGNRIGA
jgi:hypothetical protein